MSDRPVDIRYPELHDPVWLRRRYVDDGATVAELCREVGCSGELVRRALRRHEIVRAPAPGVFESPHPELNDDEWLRHAYEVEGLTGALIAERVGCGLGEVYRALRRIGIGPSSPRRTGRR